MADHENDIDILLSDAGDFIETKATLWKLKSVESLADVSGELAAGLGMIVIATLVAVILSIGMSLLIGEWTGKTYYGFFIVGGIYGIAGLICFVRRDRWMKGPFSNMLIRKILK